MLYEKLTKAGLNDSEAKVYLASLELGETNISRIAQKSGIKRTTTYLVVGGLKEKGLMHEIKKQRKTYFYAEDPRQIIEKMEENLKDMSNLVPELLAIANFIDKKPSIRFYEGKTGIKELYKDMLKYPKSEALEWYSESYATEFDESFFVDYFTPTRIKNKIWVRAILPDNPIIQKLIANNDKELRKTKLLNPKKYNIKININLYGKNKINIISFKEEIGLIIESEKIYDSLKNIFEIMWEADI